MPPVISSGSSAYDGLLHPGLSGSRYSSAAEECGAPRHLEAVRQYCSRREYCPMLLHGQCPWWMEQHVLRKPARVPDITQIR